MTLRSLNNQLQKLEELYADNIISKMSFHRAKNTVLKHIETDPDLSYDEEMNLIYRISNVKKHLLALSGRNN